MFNKNRGIAIDRQTNFYFDLDYNCKTERKHKEYNLKGKLKG